MHARCGSTIVALRLARSSVPSAIRTNPGPIDWCGTELNSNVIIRSMGTSVLLFCTTVCTTLALFLRGEREREREMMGGKGRGEEGTLFFCRCLERTCPRVSLRLRLGREGVASLEEDGGACIRSEY
jgi:hypothetical protein